MAFAQIIHPLISDQPPRVWSLLITVFGDLAQNPGQWISGTTLTQLTALIGIKPEATRVALHRLRKDGWIDSRRTGRRSDYALTERGRSESAKATPRIYKTAADDPCYVILAEPGTPQPPAHWITANIGLTTAAESPALTLPLPGPLPDWIRARVCDDDLVSAAARTRSNLAMVQSELTGAGPLTPLQTAALRVLIVHSWRRVILKAPDLPDTVFPADWQGAECRALVATLLEALPRPELTALSKAA